VPDNSFPPDPYEGTSRVVPPEPFDVFALARDFYRQRIRADPTPGTPPDFLALAGRPETLAAFCDILHRMPGATDPDRLASLVDACTRYGIGTDPALLVDSEPLP
jgi:hypothetical protein